MNQIALNQLLLTILDRMRNSADDLVSILLLIRQQLVVSVTPQMSYVMCAISKSKIQHKISRSKILIITR